jgi:hypothetical protein
MRGASQIEHALAVSVGGHGWACSVYSLNAALKRKLGTSRGWMRRLAATFAAHHAEN